MASQAIDYEKNDKYVKLYNFFSELVMPPTGHQRYYEKTLQEITSIHPQSEYITKILENFYKDIKKKPNFKEDIVLDILIDLIDYLTNKRLIADFRQTSVEDLKQPTSSFGNLKDYEEEFQDELYKAHKHASKRKQATRMHTKLMKKLNPKPQSASKSDTPCPVARPVARPALIKPKPIRLVKKSNKRKRGKIGGKKSKRKTRRRKSKKNKRKRKSRTRKH